MPATDASVRRAVTTGIAALPGWATPVAAGVAGLGACLTLAVVDPNAPGRYPLCPFRAVTGLDCPGCGSLRALHALTGGELAVAVDHNLVTVALVPVLLWGWWSWLRARLVGARPAPVPAAAGYAAAAVLTAFWIARNVAWEPLAWLASGAG